MSLSLASGETVARDVTITNSGKGPVVVRVRYADWTMDAWGGVRFLEPATLEASLAGLVEFGPKEFSLEAGESGRIQLAIQLPPAGPATRWGVLLSEVRPASASQAGGARAIAELGTTIYASRKDAAAARPELDSLRVLPIGSDSLAVLISVRNAGERHLYLSCDLSLRDSSAVEWAHDRLQGSVVLPGAVRRIEYRCAAPAAAGLHSLLATLDTGEPELLVGEAKFRWPPARPEPVWFVEQHSP